jgi:hypothetical protein
MELFCISKRHLAYNPPEERNIGKTIKRWIDQMGY